MTIAPKPPRTELSTVDQVFKLSRLKGTSYQNHRQHALTKHTHTHTLRQQPFYISHILYTIKTILKKSGRITVPFISASTKQQTKA